MDLAGVAGVRQAAGYVSSAVQKHKELNVFVCSSSFVPCLVGLCHAHSGRSFLSHLNLSGNSLSTSSQIHPQMAPDPVMLSMDINHHIDGLFL